MKRLRIATRRSALALWQTEHVAGRLRAAHPDLDIALVPLSTRGDEVLDRSLASIGGKGLFLKELEIAMQEDRADLAVHSLKDMPTQVETGFAIAAILERADPADALVSPSWPDLDLLPEGARVGSSSLRRQAQLRALRPDLTLLDLRGNVNTRLTRLDAGDYDAIVLACAGLQRLGFGSRVGQRLAPPFWLPGIGQGAIAVETRADDPVVTELVAPLHDPATATCVRAERALNHALGGDCSVSIGAFASLDGADVVVHGLVGDAGSGELLRASGRGPASTPEAVGAAVAGQLRSLGAERLLTLVA